MKFIGVDLFSGAGGMSVGAQLAGVKTRIAVESDYYAGRTYKANHPDADLYNQDIRKFKIDGKLKRLRGESIILFGGPPCQGFSTSNQKTRNKENDNNWLFTEYLRVTKELKPDWVVVENVKGIIETENGFFFEKIQNQLQKLGYKTSAAVLNAVDFGVPQIRNRLFIVGSRDGIKFKFPRPTYHTPVSVSEAIADLPMLINGANQHELEYGILQSTYQRKIRNGSMKSVNNLVTRNSGLVLERYRHVPQGGNWEDIPVRLMANYTDHTRCHTGIYHRLIADQPSVVIGNYRKNMLIHPTQDRGLSVREAARIQSFPDTFHFKGSIGFQQQQVGNSVPPLLAKALFKRILSYQ
jgi:DNA (cytosine-5)-methyltransferase 1